MKKKIIISIIILILIIVCINFITSKNRIVSTITIDINPSIEIGLNKKEKVVKMKAINEDAKELVNKKYNNKTLEETFELLITSLIDKGYDDNIDIILHTDGKVEDEDVARKIEFIFGKKDIHTEIIVIEKITKEDEELAKKYNINPAKASYIKSITKDYENINIEDLANKSVNELKETKTTGKYCDEDYTLEGDWCLKEINKKSASNGEICPEGYYEYNGECYEEIAIEETNNLVCHDEFHLEKDKCVRTETIDAIPAKFSCTSGVSKTKLELGLTSAESGDANDILCVDTSNGTHPVSPCETNDGTEYTIVGGTCYWHRAPVIASGCPGKIQVNGECWDDASNILICVGARDGKQYSSRNEFCEGSIKYNDPIISEYKCENEYTLSGDKCLKKEEEDAQREQVCPSGFNLVNKDRCINYNKTTKKENGLICNQENEKLKGNQCIIYEKVEAKDNKRSEDD